MSNTQKKNVPELRFPGFEGEWEEKKLGEVAEILDGDRGKNYPKSNEFSNKGHTLFLSASNVTKYGFSNKQSQFISEEKSNSMRNGKLIQHDIVLTSRGSIGNVFQYSDWIVDYFPFVRINSGMLILRTQDILKSNFIVKYLTSSIGKRRIKLISFGSAQPQLTKKDMKDFKIKTPLIKEQQKIGQFFSKLDRQIALEEQKLELLQQQKKGYMQKIFSQELRFKDENGNDYPEWERIKFFDVIDKVIDFRGRTPKKLNMEWSDEGYLALSAVNVKKGYIDFNVEAKYGNLDLYTRWMRGNELYKGQVLFTTEAPMGNVAQVPDNKGYILSQRTIAFNSNEKITDNFLASLLSSENVYNDLLKLCSGATAKGVSQKNLNRLYVTIPHSISEQEEIAEFFKKINRLVELQKYKIEHTKSQKQVFLQKMFI
ncbi:TPA: restriction endonuclease subunit S [Staphylococcus aureus]